MAISAAAVIAATANEPMCPDRSKPDGPPSPGFRQRYGDLELRRTVLLARLDARDESARAKKRGLCGDEGAGLPPASRHAGALAQRSPQQTIKPRT